MNENNTFYCSFVSIHYIVCECGETFPSEEELKEHLEKEHPHKTERKQYKCGTCFQVFQTEKDCIAHHQLNHSVKLVKVKEEDVPSAVRIKIEKKDGTNSIKRTNVKRTYLKNIICEVCGKKYASNAALRYHQRVHTGERPYQCTFCPKTFTMPLFLQIHIRTHTGEKPYQCPHCPKAFGNRAALLRHDRVHTGVKPYQCPKCGKTFTQSNSMKLHIHTVHLKLPAPYKSKKRRAKAALLKKDSSSEHDWDVKSEVVDNEVIDDEVIDDEVIDDEVIDDEVYYDMADGEEILYDESRGEVMYEVVYEQDTQDDLVYEQDMTEGLES